MKKTLLLFVLLKSALGFGAVLTYGVMGDGGVWNESTYLIRKSMQMGKIKQLILPGDNLYRGTYHDVWSHWRGFKIPIVAIGNHVDSYEKEMAYFSMPGEFYEVKPHPSVVFLVLNSDNEKTEKQQMNWLYARLKAAREKLVFLVYHHPSYTISTGHNWQEKESFQLKMRQIHKKFKSKIDAIFVGHDHMASLVMLDKLPMVVSGASWEWNKSPRVDYKASDGTRVRTAWMFKGGPHWVRLDIDTDSGDTWLNFVSAKPMAVVCSVLIKDGTIKGRENCSR